MIGGLIGGLVNGIANMIGTSISANAQKDINRQNVEVSRENNKAMLDAMREQTKLEQEYNSLSAQMQRAMAAGANPMLLAGAQPTSASSAGVPSLDTPVLQNPYQGFQQLGANLGSAALQAEQIALQEKQINVAEFKSKIDMLQTIGELGGSIDWTSDELKGVIRAVFGDSFDAGSIGKFARDNMVMTRLRNTVESSDLDLNKKRYLYDWLDEMTNAQYTNLLADTARKQSQYKVDRSIEALNIEKKKEVEQAIENMKVQWLSLSSQAKIDVRRLIQFTEFYTAQIDKLHAEIRKINAEAAVAREDVEYYLWNHIGFN